MSNQITAAGIEVKTQQELIDQYTAAMQAIYGADINLDPDSPDGQMMMIRIQAELDLEDLVVQIYNGFDPDLAIGNVLDQRVAINGIQRQAGTYTETDIAVVVSQALTLNGLDTDTPYTIEDNAGNRWNLISSQSPSAAGTYTYAFRAEEPGQVLTIPNTITIPVTIVLGVTSVNNPSTYTSLGINEETDASLRVRRQQATSIAGQGRYNAMLAALQNVDGVISAFIHENLSSTVDDAGVPGHSIWVIIDGSALEADIAEVIYQKRNLGCGMYGSTTHQITQLDGTIFLVRFDYVSAQDVYIKFTATSLDGVNLPNSTAILAQLPTIFVPTVNQELNINQLATLVQQIDPNTLVTVSVPTEGFSSSGSPGSYANVISPSAANKRFSVTSGNISITVTPL